MEPKFNLEFNQEQQAFHENYGRDKPETFGWVTIVESCGGNQARLIEHHARTMQAGNMTLKGVQRAARAVNDIIEQLQTWGISIETETPSKPEESSKAETSS